MLFRSQPVDRFREATRSAGWAWQDSPLPPAFADVPRHHRTIMAVEAARFHADRLRRRPDEYPDRIRGLIEDGLSRRPVEYAEAREHHERVADETDAAAGPGCTAAVPAAAGPAPGPETTGDPALQAPWSYAGLPVVALPVGRSADGMPLAVALVGRRWREDDLLRTAARLEADLGLTPSLPPVP